MNNFDDVIKINNLVKERKKLTRQIESLSMPQLVNLDRVQLMYDEVCFQFGVKKLKRTQRDAFIFVMYSLYSPQALSGNKHRGTIKRHLAKMFNIAPNAIFPSKLMLYFLRYEDFRKLASVVLDICLTTR